jgi:hypothetical protein
METYYFYLRWCRDYNELHYIDPTTDKMEWHHTLPKWIFGDIRIGLWLTIKQHAIATALQTLAFGENCLCPWHVQHLPDELWELCRPIYSKAKRKNGNPNFGEFVQPYIDREKQREAARVVGNNHVESGHLDNIRNLRDPVKLKENARVMGETYGRINKESGQWDSIKPLGAAAQHAQRWINLAPGYPPYESTPCGLSKWQKSRGIDYKDPNNRRRVS